MLLWENHEQMLLQIQVGLISLYKFGKTSLHGSYNIYLVRIIDTSFNSSLLEELVLTDREIESTLFHHLTRW